MTDMTITACAPLPGEGLVARRGDLVVVTDGQAEGPDPLLGALEEAATGDGAVLVLAAARALLTHPGQFSGACAGVTASGEVAVLVHGGARVTVAADGGAEVLLTADGSMLPVNRTFTGGTVRVWLLSGGPVAPDDRLRLDGGVIQAGGIALTVASATDLAAAPAPGGREADVTAQAPARAPEPAIPAAMLATGPTAMGAMSHEPMVADEMTTAEPPPPAAQTAAQPAAEPPSPPGHGQPGGPGAGGPARAETMMAFDTPPQVPAGVSGPAEWWFTSGQDGLAGQGDDWRPPTFVMPAGAGPAQGNKPKIHQPEGAEFEFVSFFGPDDAPAPDAHDDYAGDHHGHEVVVEPDSQDYGPVGSDLYVADPALVDGVMCSRNHFNDPNVQYCRQCGIAMVQQTARYQRGPRPPLGVLLLDDGTGFTLDKDYVVGREPVLDGDVAAGRARPLRIPDPGGTVSRLHLRISLIGWQVEVRDLNSANGSLLELPKGGEQRLQPGDSEIILPGTKIVIGHRNLQYQSYRAG